MSENARLIKVQHLKPMAKRREKSDKPRVHPELEGMNIEVTPLGQVNLQYDLDKLNAFLNRNVRDKKFKGRDDIEGALPYEGPADDDDFKPLASTRAEENEDDLPPPSDVQEEDTGLPHEEFGDGEDSGALAK